MKPLAGRVAVVAGATRGAGRGIARMLGESGATVYCTGRSSRSSGPPASGFYAGRGETIEETAEQVEALGGRGVAVRVDHGEADEVAGLVARVRRESGRLDVLVVDFWGDYEAVEFGVPFWTISLGRGRETVDSTLWPHVMTVRQLLPLMLEGGGGGLIVEVVDGDGLGYRGSLFFDLAAVVRIRLAYGMAEELSAQGIAVVAVTPGYMRSELTLDGLGVTEANWRDAIARDANFAASETPAYVGRGVAALAADPDVMRFSGGLYSSADLSAVYGFTDVDGSRPDLRRHFREVGERMGAGSTSFRWEIRRLES